MRAYNYEEAHQFVANTRNARWDGWDIILWKKNPGAFMKPKGTCRSGVWGIESRISVDTDGLWRV